MNVKYKNAIKLYLATAGIWIVFNFFVVAFVNLICRDGWELFISRVFCGGQITLSSVILLIGKMFAEALLPFFIIRMLPSTMKNWQYVVCTAVFSFIAASCAKAIIEDPMTLNRLISAFVTHFFIYGLPYYLMVKIGRYFKWL